MPRKRVSSNSSPGDPARSKKAKSDGGDNSNGSHVPRSSRWSAVSGSANVAETCRLATEDPAEAYSYICFCRLPFERSGADGGATEDDSESEGEQEDNNSPEHNTGKTNVHCDDGESCPCHKPAADHPGHERVITKAGDRIFIAQIIHTQLRCPDYFGMYTFNDHEAYGVLEVVQNLILDFVEAAGDWKKQWVLCEAMALFSLHDASLPMGMADDSERVAATYRLTGRMFLAMLADLERRELLKPDSEVQNLGLVMAMYIRLAAAMRDACDLDDGNNEQPDKPSEEDQKVDIARFDEYVHGYATKHNIKLVNLSKPDDLAELGTRDPPPAEDDAWGWEAAFTEYVRDHGTQSGPRQTAAIGGDALDITTWKSAERKAKSFDNKDPLDKKMRDAIKDGMVLQMG